MSHTDALYQSEEIDPTHTYISLSGEDVKEVIDVVNEK